MSRNKKSRSLKRVTGGVKTGSKERTKLENKQNKARKKANSKTSKPQRQRSVYQKMLDDKQPEGATKEPKKTQAIATSETEQQNALEPIEPTSIEKAALDTSIETPETTSEDDLWDQLENPDNSSNTF